jgi:hypothetical protein
MGLLLQRQLQLPHLQLLLQHQLLKLLHLHQLQ